MATADIEEYLSERDWGHTLFSKQFCGQLLLKVVKIDVVVEKFIDSKILSISERNSFGNKKRADQKLRHLLTIITEHCNRNDLQAFKTFIDILGDTHNVNTGQQLSLIYNERVKHVATLSRLSEEKSLVRNLENEISRLQIILEEKERYNECLTDERNKLVDHYRKVADDRIETFRKEILSLEKQIKMKDEDLSFAEREIGELTINKNDLENEVKLKLNVIRERDKQIVEKEWEVREAIEESNRLRIEIDTLKQQYSTAMVEDKQMSKKIEILEDELAEKENTIMNLRKNKTMTREEIKEELRNITKDHEKNLDAQVAMIKQQNEKIDDQTAKVKQQTEKIDEKEEIDSVTEAQMALIKQRIEKIDDQEAIIKQQNEKIDDQEAIIKQQNEKIDDQEAIIKQRNEKIDDQEAIIKQQNEKIDVLTRAFNLQLEEELGKITRGQAKKLDDQAAMIKQQNEKIDDQTAKVKQQNEKIDDQTAMIKQQKEKMDAIMRALNLLEKK